MTRTLLLALSILFAFFAASAEAAMTCTPTDCTPSVTYNEPTTYVSGQPLTDLKQGTVTWSYTGSAPQTLIVPATKPQGGGIPVAPVTVPVAVCKTTTLTSSVVMSTLAGGVSTASAGTPLVIDRTKLANGSPDPQCTTPNPGTNLTIQ
jgi:hypothetical protein